jgi:hypothetical protein
MKDDYEMNQRISDLKTLIDVQYCDDSRGDEYRRGMANGLLLAWYIINEPYGSEVPFLRKGERKVATEKLPPEIAFFDKRPKDEK